MLPHAYSSLAQIQHWSGMTGNQRLFDSLVAFENYPWDNRAEAPELEISDIGDVMATVYPLTITVRQSPILSLQLIYDNAQVHRNHDRADRRSFSNALKYFS
jgi:hypothetical protein